MADHDADLIERSQSLAEKLDGGSMATDELVDDFARYGLEKRAAALENIDHELRDEIGSSPHSLRRHLRLIALRRKMGGVHEALRKARR
jgi:hypothetical protein